MPQHLLSHPDIAYVDRRRAGIGPGADQSSHASSTKQIFAANAGGSTTTLVGVNSAPGTNDVNTVRRGEEFRLYNAAGNPKEETIFKITNIAVAASTTVTFSPAAATATVSGDTARLVSLDDFMDNGSLDTRLNFLDGVTYTQTVLDRMTQNDKIWALRQLSDNTGI